MTRFTLLSSNIDKLSSFIAMISKGHTICGLCNTDRKICNTEINNNCVKQYLDTELDADFTCNFMKV